MLLTALLELILGHPFITAFISGFIEEEVLLVAAVATGNGSIPFYIIFTFGLIGTVASDLMWFLLIRIKPILKFSKKVGKARQKMAARTPVGNFPPPTELKSYIFTKFTLGLRTWGIFYCGVHGMPIRKFLLNTTIASFLWLLIMISLARLFGRWLFFFFDLTESIAGVVLFILLAIGLWVYLTKLWMKKIMKSKVN